MRATLLLIEDNKEMLELIAGDLNEQYEVVKCRNGKQALAAIEHQAIHLIVSDVMMPLMNGFELCQTIKSSVKFGHIPVILLTAKNSLAAKIEGLGLGADAYIDKPFEMEYLLANISSLLNNRQKIKDYFEHTPQQASTPPPPERIFLDNLNRSILENMDDFDLDIDKLARLMDTSRTSLFRKIKSLTGMTPNELINEARLKRAAVLLSGGKYKIYEVSDMVGYRSQTNFGRNFFKQYGMTPTDYQRKMSV